MSARVFSHCAWGTQVERSILEEDRNSAPEISDHRNARGSPIGHVQWVKRLFVRLWIPPVNVSHSLATEFNIG